MQSESRTFNAEKPPKKAVFQRKVVGVQGLEPWASCSQSRRATNCATPRYEVRRSGWAYSPKCRALPVEPHPVIHFSVIIPRRAEKIKFFLSVVIPVVKAAFVPFSATGESPANAGVARLCGVSPHPIPDTTTALPNQARYQLRYTRIKICRPHPGGISTIPAFFLACKGKICLGAFCIPGAFPPPPDYSPSAAFRASTRSVFSQATPRSSRPIWP